jgi:hypothetical protein
MVTAMMKKLLAMFALLALATTARAASVEIAPLGRQGGQTVYGLALAGDIKPGDDRRVASLLGNALVEDFPGFMMLSSNGGDTDASLGIARIAHEYGMPILVRTKCLSGCAVVALSAWRGRLFIIETGAIGLHQAWVGEDYVKATPYSLEATHRVARTLRAYGVPRSIIERMIRTSPHRITYVTDTELAAIGALVKR